jgi:alkylation response protein AidB-like acyl-CoA dehydrogenase
MAMPLQDELDLLEENVRRYAERELRPHAEAMEHDPGSDVPADVLAGLRDLGLLALALPASSGGDDGQACAISRVTGALAEISPATATMFLAHAFAQRLLGRAGDAQALADVAADGSGAAPLLAYPIYAEPTELGRDALRMQVKPHPLLSGRWDMVVNAPMAQRLLLPVQLGSEASGLLLVDADAPEVQVGEPVRTLGMHGSPVADVHVKDVPLEPGRWIPVEGIDALLEASHAEMRGPAAAISAGIARSCLRTSVGYARERYQGGRQIIDHQEMRRMLGEMMWDADLCVRAVRLLCEGRLNGRESLGLYLRARAAAARATCDGVQVLGGNGYMEDYCQERCMRDAKQAQCLLGRTDALRQWMMERHLSEVVP